VPSFRSRPDDLSLTLSISSTPLLIAYPCEIWPYRLRSRGLTVTFVSTVLAIFFNTFINPIALEKIGWKYYIVFVVVLCVFGLTAYFYYPDTRGHSLEQMAVIFDGEDAEVAPVAETAVRTASIAEERKIRMSISAKEVTQHFQEKV
jgi:hypothetical protein